MSALTARGVKQMLTRAGVDYAALTITDRTVTARRVDIDYTGPWQTTNQVIIEGPNDARRAAFDVLFWGRRALSVAPYPDRDEWSE